VHASTLWSALRLEGTLGYGELFDRISNNREDWSDFSTLDFPEGWMESRQQSGGATFNEEWSRSIGAVWDLVEVARAAMQSGPLAADEDTLKQLGVFDPKVNGSGLISAVGALFIASRAASSPGLGLLDSAFLRSADTDTLASMTASILGSVAGIEWMNGLHQSVQDHEYLRTMASRLADQDIPSGEAALARVTKSALDRWTKSLADLHPDSATDLPDGRVAHLSEVVNLPSRSAKSSTLRYALRALDGQTVFVVKHSRNTPPSPSPREQHISHIGVRVRVSSLDRARTFYEQTLGLAPSKIGDTFARYGDAFALEVMAVGSSPSLRLEVPAFVIHLETTSVSELHRAVTSTGAQVVEPLRDEKGRARFTCCDPDGNLVEVVAPLGHR
jgi:predicted enzyme related to lactoylglutathione lyase